MKLILIATVIAFITITSAVDTEIKKEKLIQFVKDCKESTGASESEVTKLMLHVRPVHKCLLGCVMEHLEIVRFNHYFYKYIYN
jgi:hypothetical protein